MESISFCTAALPSLIYLPHLFFKKAINFCKHVSVTPIKITVIYRARTSALLPLEVPNSTTQC